MLYLKKLNLEDAKEEYDVLSAILPEENGFTNKYYGITIEEFKNNVVPKLIAISNEINIPEGRVPDTYYFLWNDKKIVGLFKIRHYLNEKLKQGGGHISYSILSKERQKGYATEGLKLAIIEASKIIKEDEIYLSVHKNNLASLKVQQNCGAKIVGETTDKLEYLTRIKKNI